jgi:hypothetical protein
LFVPTMVFADPVKLVIVVIVAVLPATVTVPVSEIQPLNRVAPPAATMLVT